MLSNFLITQFLDGALYALFAFTLYLIVYTGIYLYGKGPLAIRKIGFPSVEKQVASDGKTLPLLATIAAAAPFIGLASTVVHIIEALSRLTGQTDLSAIAGPIGSALYATLWGLASAIPALIAYNLYAARVERINLL